MEELVWQQRLQSHGIQVERLTPLRDWSESRVICLDGRRHGRPVRCYLKSSRRGAERELIIYRFAAGHPGFPAPEATSLIADGEEWLLLDRAKGTLLADIAVAGHSGSYLTAARGMARFHTRSATAGWTARLARLGLLKEQIEVLPSSALESVHRKVAQGIYGGVSSSLLSQVETKSAQLWPGLLENFLCYPDSLIHGDCHYGNLFLTPEGAICLIDWGSAAIAPGLMDLAALVDVSVRMSAPIDPEADVLEAYFAELSQPERDAYGKPERAWAACRSVRAFLELEWFATTEDDYGQRVQRELVLLQALFQL